jgi:hypothetical protein
MTAGAKVIPIAGARNGTASTALRRDINELYQVARGKLTEDGYEGDELERLAARMVEAYLAGRNGFLPIARGSRG